MRVHGNLLQLGAGLLLAGLLCSAALAQTDMTGQADMTRTTSTTTTTTSGGGAAAATSTPQTIAQQQAAIQAQITQGITSGSLTDAQIGALQAQQDRLNALPAEAAAQRTGLGRVGVPRGETITPMQAGALQAGTAARTQTGPDPFTYNTLGPDAYHSQRYQNPAYNVPAYPTTDATSLDTQQQYSAPSAGAPYGAGYGQAPGAGGALPNVYVYHPSMSR